MSETTVVYKSDPVRGAVWHAVFAAEAPHLRLIDWTPDLDAATAPYLVAWMPPDGLSRAMPALRVLFCIGAGVDHLPMDRIAPDIRIVRMVDPELTRSMVEYVLLAVLAQHRDLPAFLDAQRHGRWSPAPVRRAADHVVGIMGLGTLGRAAAEALRALGFPVRGWSASQRDLDGVETFAGPGEIDAFLARTRSLVCLLPLTAETRGILNAAVFERLPKGAGLVNVGRGDHLVEADLLSALDAGYLSSAILDVLVDEPPAAGHPLVRHPRVIVTPHIASATHPATAARRVIAAIDRHRSGLPLDDVVDRGRGY